MMVAVSNAVFRCLREKAKCEGTTAANGTPLVSCAGAKNECDPQAYTAAEEFLKVSGICKEMKVDVLKPGCGNMITEFGKDCDLGEANGTPTAACSEKCKASVAAPAEDSSATVPVAAQPQAGNNAAGGTCALHP